MNALGCRLATSASSKNRSGLVGVVGACASLDQVRSPQVNWAGTETWSRSHGTACGVTDPLELFAASQPTSLSCYPLPCFTRT